MPGLKEFLAERDTALSRLDLGWARQQCPSGDDETLLLGMHKARLECTSIASELRHESMEWLKARGSSRMGGAPFPDDGALP